MWKLHISGINNRQPFLCLAFFYLSWCFRGSSLLLHVSPIHSLSLPNSIGCCMRFLGLIRQITCGLNNRNVLFHSFGGWTSEIKELVGLCSLWRFTGRTLPCYWWVLAVGIAWFGAAYVPSLLLSLHGHPPSVSVSKFPSFL